MENISKESIEKEIHELREKAKGKLEYRAFVGRGYSGLTDELLQEANALELQADSLERILKKNQG